MKLNLFVGNSVFKAVLHKNQCVKVMNNALIPFSSNE